MGVKIIVIEKHYIDGKFRTREHYHNLFDMLSDRALSRIIEKWYENWNKKHPHDTMEIVRVERIETGRGKWKTKRAI